MVVWMPKLDRGFIIYIVILPRCAECPCGKTLIASTSVIGHFWVILDYLVLVYYLCCPRINLYSAHLFITSVLLKKLIFYLQYKCFLWFFFFYYHALLNFIMHFSWCFISRFTKSLHVSESSVSLACSTRVMLYDVINTELTRHTSSPVQQQSLVTSSH